MYVCTGIYLVLLPCPAVLTAALYYPRTNIFIDLIGYKWRVSWTGAKGWSQIDAHDYAYAYMPIHTHIYTFLGYWNYVKMLQGMRKSLIMPKLLQTVGYERENKIWMWDCDVLGIQYINRWKCLNNCLRASSG